MRTAKSNVRLRISTGRSSAFTLFINLVLLFLSLDFGFPPFLLLPFAFCLFTFAFPASPSHRCTAAALAGLLPTHLPADSSRAAPTTAVQSRAPTHSACARIPASTFVRGGIGCLHASPETLRSSNTTRSRDRCSGLAATLRCHRSWRTRIQGRRLPVRLFDKPAQALQAPLRRHASTTPVHRTSPRAE